MNKRYLNLLIMTSALVPVVFIVLLIRKYAVNVPFGDDWAMPKLFYSIGHGGLHFADLWRQHNEHRIFFPNVTMLIVAYLTHWNIKVQIWFNLLLSFFTISILVFFIYRTIRDNFLRSCLIVITVAWFFSPVQFENWLWGWQVSWFMCILATVSSIFLLNRVRSLERTPYYFTLATIAAIVASFSLGGGLAVWVAGLTILLIKKTELKTTLLWTLIGLVSTVLYYIGYKKPNQSPSSTYFVHHKIETVRYFLTLFGRPVSDNQQAALIIGALILASTISIALLVWRKRRKLISTTSPLIAVAVFCLITMTLTTISRVGFGVDQALASRYTAISSLLIIVLLIIAGMLADNSSKTEKNVSMAVVPLILINVPLLFFSYSNGISGLKGRSIYMSEVKQCTHQEGLSDVCANETFPGFGNTVKSELPYIKNKSWGGY